MRRSPFFDLLQPGCAISSDFGRVAVHRPQHNVHLPQNGFDIANDRDMGVESFFDRSWVDVDVNDPSLGTKLGKLPGHTIVKTRADSD
jgi:hypothetical protein